MAGTTDTLRTSNSLNPLSKKRAVVNKKARKVKDKKRSNY